MSVSMLPPKTPTTQAKNDAASAWLDYEARYKEGLANATNILWRETGARQKAQHILEVCRERQIDSLIEIGCGTGAVIQKLSEHDLARTYVASDISLSALHSLRDTSGAWLAGAVVANASHLPLNDRAFSLAVLSHVVEHLEIPALAVREAARVAELVVVEVPCEKVLSNFIRIKLLRQSYAAARDAGHVQFWSQASFERFIEVDCRLEILAKKRDLISREVELFGKTGLKKLKALFKECLKVLLPTSIYAWSFTTHLTLLCRPAVGDRSNVVANIADARVQSALYENR
jgi:SAM-dependent methyltransferase